MVNGEWLIANDQLFEAQVAKSPDAIAVASGDPLTYAQLNAIANGIAHQLRAHGVGSEVLVALLCERGSVSLGASPSAVCLRFDDAGRVTFHSDSERVAEVQHLFVRHAELSSELEHADLLFSQGVLLSSGIEI